MIIIRYLIKETLKSQFAVLFVLFLIFISQKFIRELANATDGKIPGDLILQIVALNMPTMALLMLPLSIYIGILLTFGRLYAESEITVMNATGMGNTILIRAAFFLAVITGGIAAVNSFWLAPVSQEKTTQVLEAVKADSGLELLVKGQFQSAPNGQAVVFVQDIENKGRDLNNIFVAQPMLSASARPSVLLSKTGTVTESPDGRQVLNLKDGTRYEGTPTQQDMMITNFSDYEALIGQREIQEKKRKWRAHSTMDLLASDDLSAKAEFQWRASLVLCIPLLTMIVVPLSSVNPRQGRFAKLMPAIFLYLLYFLAISAGKSAIEDGGLPPEIGLWSINLLLFFIAIGINSWDSMPIRKLKASIRGRK
ncbi:LPS export ABC transporter permease LptF [Vibrio sp. SS-MA-C1-2]|uniref:LPS export ABC transporter permease LptF n=1 Tax=Vibrio sp. SS-MA-C1-2 TaxID=2908646 RepID=UPI001F22391A|nr:LPS export ABC transporter permease LptF [Vibrio sp. SS-MA-C1-2]UJF19599.1 LPS export ABC transporter permease LptF [Vibrio sp. SS-MA-C1-2]